MLTSMANLITCDACKASLRVPDEYLGMKAWCPHCNAPITVPGHRKPRHDVFISYSVKDNAIAEAIRAKLEKQEIRCWIASRDIPAGNSWGETIIKAIEDAQILVLVYSGNANQSPQVVREVERAVAKGLAIVPVRIEAVPMSREMEYFLSASHWFDALTRPVENHLPRLADTVNMLLLKKAHGETPIPKLAQPPPQLRPGFPWIRTVLGLSLLLVFFIMAALVLQHRHTLLPRLAKNQHIQVILNYLMPVPPTVGTDFNGTETAGSTTNIEVITHTTIVERTSSGADSEVTLANIATPVITRTALYRYSGRSVNLSAPFENSLGMKFVPVPGTRVLFSIWDTRVQDYRLFAVASKKFWFKPQINQGPTHPVVCLLWGNAKEFCSWLTEKEREEGLIGLQQFYRLPTDEEWSLAVGLPPESGNTPEEKERKARDIVFGHGKHPNDPWPPNFFPWGGEWPPPRGAGNFSSELHVDDFKEDGPVGSFAVNKFGLYDMGGNVMQMCEDYYKGSKGSTHIARGSTYYASSEIVLMSAARGTCSESQPDQQIGFRCVLADGLSATAPISVASRSSTARLMPETQTSGDSWSNSLGMVFVPVPGTKVLFSIWDTRVQDYQAFATATYHAWNDSGFEQGPTHPAIQVSRRDAHFFCDWLTMKERNEGRLSSQQAYRLPTDEEWSTAVGLAPEKGATPREKYDRHTSKLRWGKPDTDEAVFPWGQQWPPPQNAGNLSPKLNIDEFDRTSPVGSFPANRFGLYDMGGNVNQLCEDFEHGQTGACIVRGSAYNFSSEMCSLVSWSRGFSPAYQYSGDHFTGFRCVLEGGMPRKKEGTRSY